MSRLDRNLYALALCYRILGGLVGLIVSLYTLTVVGSALQNMAFPLLLLSAGVAFSIAVFKTAGALENHRQKTFCLVVAWIACALFPLGTVLGVFTILQLIQYEADRAFSEEENPYFTMEDFRDPSK